jgi:3-hydroxyacyl-[acyl-carrier-protein] dehydratase
VTPTATTTAPPAAPDPPRASPVPAGPAPGHPSAAAPMRAVDSWHSERTAAGFAVTARLRVDGDDPNLRGHFPGFPVLPGVFLVEAVCQAMALGAGGPGAGPAPRLRVLHSVRFLAPLLGGDELTLRIDATAADDGGWRVTAEGHRADGTRVTRIRAEFGGAR